MESIITDLAMAKLIFGEAGGSDLIDGHSTEFYKVYVALYHRLKNLYPINEVPKDLEKELEAVRLILMKAENAVQQYLDSLVADIKKDIGKGIDRMEGFV